MNRSVREFLKRAHWGPHIGWGAVPNAVLIVIINHIPTLFSLGLPGFLRGTGNSSCSLSGSIAAPDGEAGGNNLLLNATRCWGSPQRRACLLACVFSSLASCQTGQIFLEFPDFGERPRYTILHAERNTVRFVISHARHVVWPTLG